MMNSNNTPERSDLEDLFPWHAAGTLNQSDAERVARALTQDPELARRFGLVQEELGETIHLNEMLGAPSTRAMETLFAAIDAEPKRARKPRFAFDFAARLSDLFGAFSGRQLAFAATAAAAVIVLQSGIIAGVLLNQGVSPAPFVVQSAVDADPDGSFAMVRFSPQATAADIAAVLKEYQASIVSGPSGAANMFKVRMGLPKSDLSRVVKSLQGDGKVIVSAFPSDQ